MSQIQKTRPDDVKGTVLNGTSPDRSLSTQQGAFDRHQGTACNTRTIQIQNLFLTAQSTQIKSVISVPIKDCIHHYPRALFNDIPSVRAQFNDIPGSHTRTKMKIATWNVRTMHQAGKLQNVKEEAIRLKVDILGLAEARWLGSGKLVSEDHTLIYSGHKKEHKHGVGLLLSNVVARSVIGFQ